MQPLKLIIPGMFWDSQLYSGRLYLFQRDGSIRTVQWDSLLGSLGIDLGYRVALVAGFLRSNFLYSHELKALFHDPDILQIVQTKLAALSEMALQPTESAITRHTIGHQNNPFPFPHSDTEIYSNTLYVGGPSGLWSASCRRTLKSPVGSRTTRMFDGPVLGLAASYQTVAAATGDSGLFEFSVNWDSPLAVLPARPSVDKRCEDCNWTFQSIYGSSAAGGFLVDYKRLDRDEARSESMGGDGDSFETSEGRRWRGELDRVIDASEIFHDGGYSWGVHDKICLATNGHIRVARYLPWKEDRQERLANVGYIDAARGTDELVGAAAAPFGAVVEYSDCLVVYCSDGTQAILSGEPVNWRVFPRSKFYENQLHVIYPDRLEVFSFNHDYLLDQEQKVIGTSVRLHGPKWSKGLSNLMSGDTQENPLPPMKPR